MHVVMLVLLLQMPFFAYCYKGQDVPFLHAEAGYLMQKYAGGGELRQLKDL